MAIVKAYVEANTHCNLDSFPLRFGFFFEKDQIIEVERSSEDRRANKPGRFSFEGWMVNPDTDEKVSAVFVMTKEKKQGAHILVTAWRHEYDSEYLLSETIRKLRETGRITPEWLVSIHRHYVSGALRSSADLLDLMASEKSREDNKLAQDEINKLREDNEKWQEKFQQMLEAGKQSVIEETEAESKGDFVASTRGVLKGVEENVVRGPSSCTVLELDDGSKWYMKTSTFDRDGSVTTRAKELIGEKVRVTSWDPLSEPGKWSSKGYFRRIYLDKVSD